VAKTDVDGVPKELVADGALLPVLDGLDEIPAELHAIAIEALDLATAGGVPYVLTCRAEEYGRAVAAGGRALSAAAVVEVPAESPPALAPASSS
jgi:hypothetical protein